MQNYKEDGSNVRRAMSIRGSFKYTAAGNLVGVIRDGKSSLIASVTRVSPGLYTVALNTSSKYPVPLRNVTETVKVSHSATPTKVSDAKYVAGSWDPVAKTFQIVNLVVGTVGGAAAAPVVGDPDDGARISFTLVGSLSGAGTDAA
jgi:hypothetical protein